MDYKKVAKEVIAEENTGFVPGTKDRRFSVILTFDKDPQDIFDIDLSPDEYKNEKSFLNAILAETEKHKLPTLVKISVAQLYTASEDQLLDFIKKNGGKWYFR